MGAPDRPLYADRAARAYQTMLRRFRRGDGLYRYDEGPPIRRAAQLWPFARALVATLDVAGIGSVLPGGLDMDRLISEHLRVLERYWDPAGPRPAYSSEITGARRRRDRYYDDNAWVGLALIELERLRPGSGMLDRAEDLFRFAASGWDEKHGGVYWVEQGRGTGKRNHDRNIVSTAPHAEIGLHLAELGRRQRPEGRSVTPREMYAWVLAHLDASREGGSPGTGPFWDKIRGDGTIDQRTWSYNQGSMVGANVLLARLNPAERQAYLGRAEAIARGALEHLAGAYDRQPAAFHAIFLRNLLLLHEATEDESLRGAIMSALREFADRAWPQAQHGPRKLFGAFSGGPSLLDQSAYVQVLALLAWEPGSYGRLA
jgi:hypothetical protein